MFRNKSKSKVGTSSISSRAERMNSLGAFVRRLRLGVQQMHVEDESTVESSPHVVPSNSEMLLVSSNSPVVSAPTSASHGHDALVCYSLDSTDSEILADSGLSENMDVEMLMGQLLDDATALTEQSTPCTAASFAMAPFEFLTDASPLSESQPASSGANVVSSFSSLLDGEAIDGARGGDIEASLASTFASVTALITSDASRNGHLPGESSHHAVAAIETTLTESEDSLVILEPSGDDASPDSPIRPIAAESVSSEVHSPVLSRSPAASTTLPVTQASASAASLTTSSLPPCYVALNRLRIVSHSPPRNSSGSESVQSVNPEMRRHDLNNPPSDPANVAKKSVAKSSASTTKPAKTVAERTVDAVQQRSKSLGATARKKAKSVQFALPANSASSLSSGAASARCSSPSDRRGVKRKRGPELKASSSCEREPEEEDDDVPRSSRARSTRAQRKSERANGKVAANARRLTETKRRGKNSKSSSPQVASSADTSDETSDEEESSASDHSASAGSTRRKSKPKPKGDLETRARQYLMAHPKQLFADAELVVQMGAEKQKKKSKRQSTDDGRSAPKCVPTVYVPPMDPDDLHRARHSTATIRAHVDSFCADTSTKLFLRHYQHLERLEIIRQLLVRTYTGQHDVGPILRLLRENGRPTDDPLTMLAQALRPELINTRHSTQVGSAPLTIFNYLMPLFMQRWGIMAAGTSVPQQWRSIGQMYNNWKGGGRWPELLMAAPEFVLATAQDLFENGTVPSEFQIALARNFVHEPAPLAKWCYMRRSARSVNTDKTGKSLFMDLIVPPMAVWLRQHAPDLLTEAVAVAEAEALPVDVAARLQYPSLNVYRHAVDTLTQLLAGASSHVSFGKLVETVLTPDAAVAGGTPTLRAVWQWTGMDADSDTSLAVDIPLPRWRAMKDTLVALALEESNSPSIDMRASPTLLAAANSSSPSAVPEEVESASVSMTTTPSESFAPSLVQQSSAVDILQPAPSNQTTTVADSVASAIKITGLNGELTEVTLREILAMAGGISEVYFDEPGGALFINFDNADSARRTLFGLYGTATRVRSLRAVAITSEAFELAREAILRIETQRANATASSSSSSILAPVRNFGTHQRKSNQLNTSLLLMRPPPTTPIAELDDALAQVKQRVCALEAFMMAADEPSALLIDAAKRFVVLSDDPYDFYGSRLEFGPLFENPAACSQAALLFLLREVVLAHLQIHPADSVFVTPPSWFNSASTLADATAPQPLYDVTGVLTNVSDCRLLLCPTFHNQQPVLLFIAFPQSLNNFQCQLCAPFIVLFGAGLTPAVVQSLLVFVLIRLERLLGTAAALVQPNVCVVNFGPISQIDGGTDEKFQAYVKLAHAARVMLLLLSTTEALSLRRDFFVNTELLAHTRAILAQLCQDESGNPQMEDVAESARVQALDGWRTLAGIANREQTLSWNDGSQLTAYSAYLVHRYLRAQDLPDWTNFATVRKWISTSTAKVGYELATCELRQHGQFALRAFCARIQQLHLLGFRALSANAAGVALCHRSTEHVLLPLPEFGLQQGVNEYTDTEEQRFQVVGNGSPPFWDKQTAF